MVSRQVYWVALAEQFSLPGYTVCFAWVHAINSEIKTMNSINKCTGKLKYVRTPVSYLDKYTEVAVIQV